MDEVQPNNQLQQRDIFELFILQLQKDFENAGRDSDFIASLKPDFDLIKSAILHNIEILFKQNSSGLSQLLYRIDISERQLEKYCTLYPLLSFQEVVAELIIKRVLQKVILKKRFSK